MKKKYQQTDLYLSKIDELEHTIEELKSLNDIDHTLADYSYLNATVMSRNVGYWYDTITINRGKNNKVTNDMAVITSKGLIGKIVNVTDFTSTVKLLSSNDLNMKISIKIKIDNDYIYGLLTGYDLESKCYIVEGISYAGEIPVNSVVTTTGMSDIFPSGILVGKVELVETDNFDLAKIVKVKTDINYDQLSYVTILKRDIND
jgi:rod shape-determining protein MreC